MGGEESYIMYGTSKNGADSTEQFVNVAFKQKAFTKTYEFQTTLALKDVSKLDATTDVYDLAQHAVLLYTKNADTAAETLVDLRELLHNRSRVV
jgi:hypothetical protein